jgi:hypothetical protein
MNLNQSSKLRQTPNLTTGRIVAEDSAAGLLKNPDLLRAYLGVCWRISKTDSSTQIFAREEFQRLNRGVGAAKPKVPIAGRFPLSAAAKAHDPLKGLILGRSCSKSDRGELVL